jgi:small subunit ribosomal protein S15
MISVEQKKISRERYRIHERDTGSSRIQVAALTERIDDLNRHFKSNPKDNASKTGLMKLVGRRRRLLRYIEKRHNVQYQELIKSLGIRG